MFYYLICFLKVSLVTSLLVAPSFASDNTPLKDAIAHMKKQQYEQAIPLFLSAREQGTRSDQLSYNLGIAYYKTKKYTQALLEFESISSASSLNDMAQFNLGLVAIKQNRLESARETFRQLIERDESGKAGKLAVVMLDRITEDDVKAAWLTKEYAFALIEYGMEDKSISPEEDGGSVSSEKNQYLDALILLSLKLLPSKVEGLNSRFTLFGLRNVQTSEYDLAFFSVDVEKAYRMGAIENQLSLGATSMQLGNDPYSANSHVSHRSEKAFSLHRQARLQYTFYMHRALKNEYQALSGQQHRLQTVYEQTISSWKYQFGYEYEYNQRDDKASLSGYRSYSPARHKLWTELILFGSRVLSPGLKLEYRDSRYAASSNSGNERHDERFRARAKLNYDVTKDLGLNLEYVYTQNQSTLSSYDYRRNEVVAGMEYSF